MVSLGKHTWHMTYQRQTHERLLRAISHGAWQRLTLKWLFNTGYEPPRCPVALGKAAVQEPSVRLIPANQRSVEPQARSRVEHIGSGTPGERFGPGADPHLKVVGSLRNSLDHLFAKYKGSHRDLCRAPGSLG